MTPTKTLASAIARYTVEKSREITAQNPGKLPSEIYKYNNINILAENEIFPFFPLT